MDSPVARRAPVSVLIPCFRCAGTIGRAVRSVAEQTRVPAEVILVEDGSGDGTLGHLQALVACYAPGWIRVLALERNGGTADARNAGWAAAVQPWIAFLDADDAWHPRKIELQHAYMAAHPEVALSGHDCGIVLAGAPTHRDIATLDAYPVSRLSLLLSNSLVTPSVMLRRDLPNRFRPGRRHVDDHLLWLQLHFEGHRLVRFRQQLAYVFKPMYGNRGLSGELWPMEKAELENYRILRAEKRIGLAALLGLWAYSLVKYLRRVLLTLARRRAGPAT